MRFVRFGCASYARWRGVPLEPDATPDQLCGSHGKAIKTGEDFAAISRVMGPAPSAEELGAQPVSYADYASWHSQESVRDREDLMHAMRMCGIVCTCVVQVLSAKPRRLEKEVDLVVPSSEARPIVEVSTAIAGPAHTWVVDPVQGLIFQFDTLGRFQRVAGGKGSSAGQYSWPLLGGYLDGKLWVWDQQLARIAVLDASLDIRQMLKTTDGYVAALVDGGELAYPAFMDTNRVPLLYMTETGNVHDTVAVLKKANGWISVPLSSGAARIHQPFQTNDLWRFTATGDGVVVVEGSQSHLSASGTVRVMRLSKMGDTLFAVDLPVPRQPMTQALVRDAARALLSNLESTVASRGDSVLPGAFETVLRQIDVPDFTPPVAAVFGDASGRTWIELRGRFTASYPRWIVLDSHGVVVYEIRDQSGGPFLAARGNRVWLAEQVGGGRHVEQYRIVP
jgi:hypothetical protein